MSPDIEVCVMGINEIAREGLRGVVKSNSDFNVSIAGLGDPLPRINTDRLLLLDATGSMDIVAFVKQIQQSCNPRWIVVMSDDSDINTIMAAFSVGVDGFLARSISCETLIASLKLVIVGGKVIPSYLVTAFGEAALQPPLPTWQPSEERLRSLSEREITILSGIIAGYPNKMIAARLNLAESTTKAHIKAILRKLHVNNRVQAAILGYQQGIQPIMSMGPSDNPS